MIPDSEQRGLQNPPPSRGVRILAVLLRPRTILAVYVLLSVAVSFQKYYGPPRYLWGGEYTHYNVYETFRHAYPNLITGRDLYAPHPEQHGDLYKYSPTFALLMAPFWWLPVLPGLNLWNLLNSLVLFAALATLPVKGFRPRALMLWFVLFELVTSMQNTQSNGLMAGLMVMGFNQSEKGHAGLASLLWTIASFIKPFALPAFLIFLLYDRGRLRALAWSAVWFGLFALAPLAVIPWSELLGHYASWGNLLQADTAGPGHLSVRGVWNLWTGVTISNTAVVGTGIVLLLASWWRQRRGGSGYGRMAFLASLLVWVIIFNHKAESPTYVIAMTGVCIWYFSQSPARFRSILFGAAMVLTSLSPTFFFPPYLRSAVVYPLKLKAVPCFLIYGRQWWELIRQRLSPRPGDFGSH